MNSYPFLDNKRKPIFTADLGELVPRLRKERIIDITNSPLVAAASLRTKLELLHRAGELDGGLPIVRQDVLVGLIPAPDLGFALDQLENESSALCLMDRVPSIDDDDDEVDPTDFTPFIDPVRNIASSHIWTLTKMQAPVALDINSPMDLVYECFAKLGLRYICVLKNGKYAGMVCVRSLNLGPWANVVIADSQEIVCEVHERSRGARGVYVRPPPPFFDYRRLFFLRLLFLYSWRRMHGHGHGVVVVTVLWTWLSPIPLIERGIALQGPAYDTVATEDGSREETVKARIRIQTLQYRELSV